MPSGGTIGGFTIQGDQLLGDGSTLIIDGGTSPKVQFLNGSDQIVTLNSSTQLTPVELGTFFLLY